ncbi:FAD-dependent oxidoreductase [Kaarinaea lacus]
MSQALTEFDQDYIRDHSSAPVLESQALPVVIVGNGPVGMHAARELLKRQPDAHIVLYGNEYHQPYNRVKLSYLLSGELDWDALLEKLAVPETATVEERIGYSISLINPNEQYVEDTSGNRQSYSKLILATGSHPHIPNIKGIERKGVFTFRSLDDANLLLARRVRTQHTVILGGGLLGIEAARGMQRNNTEVTVIEHADRLLGHQLDEKASETLRNQLTRLDIHTIVGDGVSNILGGSRVTGIRLRSGRIIDCDTIILATGIRPNTELAVSAGLSFAKGIRVDDNMSTSIPNIYAIGECAEHREKVYGMVAPGLEQAAVAVNHILGNESQFQGSVIAARLKIAGCPVISAGPVGYTASPNFGKSYIFQDREKTIYRKIVTHRNRLVGVIGVGDWEEANRALIGVSNKQWILPWHIMRFLRTGNIWPEEEAANVKDWPATIAVCQCTGATRGQIGTAIQCGAKTVTDITETTGAAGVCGSCRPLLQELLGSNIQEPVAWHKALTTTALLSLALALMVIISPAIPYSSSVQTGWHLDDIWRNSFYKQISGFTILGLFVLGLLVSPRKRMKQFQKLGSFDTWRFTHILLGIMVVGGLVIHTGMRFGNGLNYLLMFTFTATVALGAVATAVISQEHRFGTNATWLRRRTIWWHILLFWPVPVVLGFHILKSYYF